MKSVIAIVAVLTLAGCGAGPVNPSPTGNPSITVGTDRLSNYKLKINSIDDCETLSREYEKQDTGDDPQRDARMKIVEDKMNESNCFEENFVDEIDIDSKKKKKSSVKKSARKRR